MSTPKFFAIILWYCICYFQFRNFNKENLAKTASNITQDLRSIARMMESQVKQSEADMHELGKIQHKSFFFGKCWAQLCYSYNELILM